jgi:hypothetical protein
MLWLMDMKLLSSLLVIGLVLLAAGLILMLVY